MPSYTQFSSGREDLWSSFAKRLEAARVSPRTLSFADLETIAVDYRRILQDHALAKAKFPGSAAARRTETLTISATHLLFADHDRKRFSLARFFGTLFPISMRAHAPYMGFCLALFACSIVMSYSLSTIQPAIGARILGQETIANLEKGELWTESIARVVPSSVSSSFIATNNMSVAITAWAGGALAGIGSIYVVITNGFLLGAIFGTTSRFGMTSDLLEFISAHGPLELTLILVSAGHGLAMGHALLAPHDHAREAAVRSAARLSMIGLVGSLPWFLLLGLVEGFISPAATIGVDVKLALGAAILSCFLLVAFRPVNKEEQRT